MIGVELFSGAGGLSQGAHQAGIRVSHAIELSKTAASTFKLNHPNTTVINADIRGIKPKELCIPREPIILFGGPPCQGFSTSNQRSRNSTNSNNWLFGEFLRFVSELLPDAVLFENVSGITHTENGFFEQQLRYGLNNLGYSTEATLADAAQLGVPQRRTRYFCVGSRTGKVSLANIHEECPLISVGEAIGDLPMLAVGHAEPIGNYRSPPLSAFATKMRGQLDSCSGHLATRCSIPDDYIDPRRSALFMARSILREVREGVRAC